MICIHHSKDMDGYASGAIVKHKYPDAKLIGWDYADEIPDFKQFIGEEVIMIDITFPLERLINLGELCKLTVIDHHISFKKGVDLWNGQVLGELPFTYIYEDRQAACEIGWKYLFPDETLPYAITLIGRYDTWRQDEGNWSGETLPFKYYMYGNCNSAQSFPQIYFKNSSELTVEELVNATAGAIEIGKGIMKYQEMMDEAATRSLSFDKIVFSNHGLRALCMNQSFFNSETLKAKYNKEDYDIMVGFTFTGSKWGVSLRSDKPEVDVSVIAKERGGGGHKGAAGFEVDSFDKIFM